jgi:hypothetical protein
MVGFVNLADETQSRITSEEAGFQVTGIAGLWPELDRRSDPGLVLNEVWEPVRGRNAEPFVGVDVKNPVAATAVESVVPGSREIAGPSEVMEPGSMVLCDFDRPVRRTSVNDHDFVDVAGKRSEASFEELLLIPDDKCSAYCWHNHLAGLLPVAFL